MSASRGHFAHSSSIGNLELYLQGHSFLQLEYTKHQAFDEVNGLIHTAISHQSLWHHVLKYYFLNCFTDTSPILSVTGAGCITRILDVISLGPMDSAKLNSVQQNHLLQEVEMVTRVEEVLVFTNILQDVNFQWMADSRGITYLLRLEFLSGRRARWLEEFTVFALKVVVAEEVLMLAGIEACMVTRWGHRDGPCVEQLTEKVIVR